MLRYAKYIIAGQTFAEEYTGIKADFSNPTTLLELYKKFATKFPNNYLVVTLKDHGAMFLDGNQIKVMPGLKVDSIKDNTGAGDIFRAAFAAGVSRGYDIEKIVRISNIAAGLSLSKIGAQDSIPLFSDVANVYESKFGPIDGVATTQNVTQQVQETTNTQNIETNTNITQDNNTNVEEENSNQPVDNNLEQQMNSEINNSIDSNKVNISAQAVPQEMETGDNNSNDGTV